MTIEHLTQRIGLLSRLLNGAIKPSARQKAAIRRYWTGQSDRSPCERTVRRQRHFERYMDKYCALTGTRWRD